MRKLVLACLCLAAAPDLVWAQSNEDINSVLQFNFSNPGARSLAMAGAFTARADDATAVYANPAGLIQLSRPEISFEGRSWSFYNRFLNGGTQLNPGTFDGLAFQETDDSASGLSFLSAFYPSKSGRWVIGAFRHETIHYTTELHTEDASFAADSSGFVRPRDGFLNLDIEAIGVSFAYQVSKQFSLGLTVSHMDFEIDSRLELFDAARDEEVGDPVFNPFSLDEGFPGLTEGDPELCCWFGDRGDIITLRTQQGTDDSLAYTSGLFWESPKTRAGVPLVTAGAVYRQGPEFSFAGDAYFRSHSPSTTPPTTRTFEQFLPGGTGRGVFDVPTVIGAGASYRPSKRWVISADYARVKYGDLMDEFLALAPGDSGLPFGQTGTAADYKMKDGDEWRLGGEYAVSLGAPLVFLRGGLWFDPEHEIEYTGADIRQRAVFSPGDDELHWSLGAGFKFRDFQLDAAMDISDRIDTFSLSTVFYLGRD